MIENVTRRDVITLASSILVNLGLINSAALAASLAEIDAFKHIATTPFAIGLISAIFAQLMWYFDIELEHEFERNMFSHDLSQVIADLIMSFLIIGGGVLSASCVIYGCFRILDLTHSDSLDLLQK